MCWLREAGVSVRVLLLGTQESTLTVKKIVYSSLKSQTWNWEGGSVIKYLPCKQEEKNSDPQAPM